MDPEESYRNLLRFELEWEHGPIGSRSSPFPLWEMFKEFVGDPIAMSLVEGRVHLAPCYTCSVPLLIPIGELNTPTEDQQAPTEILLRCQRCHDRVAWESMELSPEELVDKQVVLMASFRELMGRVLEVDEGLTGNDGDEGEKER